jgi:hypothetical protein
MNNPETGYDDPNINNNGGNAGYPEFSAVHEYPKVDKLVPRGNQFQQKKIEPQKIQAQKKQTKAKKKKKIKPMFVPYELEIVALLASSDTLISSHFILFSSVLKQNITFSSFKPINFPYKKSPLDPT